MHSDRLKLNIDAETCKQNDLCSSFSVDVLSSQSDNIMD